MTFFEVPLETDHRDIHVNLKWVSNIHKIFIHSFIYLFNYIFVATTTLNHHDFLSTSFNTFYLITSTPDFRCCWSSVLYWQDFPLSSWSDLLCRYPLRTWQVLGPVQSAWLEKKNNYKYQSRSAKNVRNQEATTPLQIPTTIQRKNTQSKAVSNTYWKKDQHGE